MGQKNKTKAEGNSGLLVDEIEAIAKARLEAVGSHGLFAERACRFQFSAHERRGLQAMKRWFRDSKYGGANGCRNFRQCNVSKVLNTERGADTKQVGVKRAQSEVPDLGSFFDR